MYFQLEVDYYSDEANKNKYTHLVNSINKKQLKVAGCEGHCTCKDNFSYFVAST